MNAKQAADKIADSIEAGKNRLSGTYSSITIGPETRGDFKKIIQQAIDDGVKKAKKK